jgi:hypothetical protein
MIYGKQASYTSYNSITPTGLTNCLECCASSHTFASAVLLNPVFTWMPVIKRT